MDIRSAAFQRLKPVCVELNQAVLDVQGRSGNPAHVTERLHRLRTTLGQLPQQSLDSKLAEYVFVPLSHVLRLTQSLPFEAVELTFECLAVLLRDGWREKVVGPLAAQLLILFTITVDKSKPTSGSGPAKNASRLHDGGPSQALLVAVLSCLEHLLHGLSSTEKGRAQLLESSTVPNLGQSVVVILEVLVFSDQAATQVAASKALDSLVRSIGHDHQTLASFLPGIVSSLTKVLTPSTQIRRSWKVLSNSLRTLKLLLLGTVCNNAAVEAGITLTTPSENPGLDMDTAASGDRNKGNTTLQDSTRSATAPKLGRPWLEATAGQLKLALANINRLHSHDRQEIRLDLFDLYLTIVRDCSQTLPNCRQMCLEVLTILSEDSAAGDSKAQLYEALRTTADLSNSLQSTLRDWAVSLPRVLGGADEDKKNRRLKQLFTAYNMLVDSGQETRTVEDLIIVELPEFVNTILGNRVGTRSTISEVPTVRLDDLPIMLHGRGSLTFADPLSSNVHQLSLLRSIQRQLQHLSDVDRLAAVAEAFGSLVRTTEGNLRTSAFYLALSSLRTTSDADALFNLDTSPWRDDLLADLYDFSVSILTAGDPNDSRNTLLAIETVAMQSTALGQAFRPELLDVLYPVLSFLAPSDPRITNHAITCLNIMAQSCEYASVKDLVAENADYITNSIALKLNAFEVDPEAPQVLVIAVNLAGSDLVPYLGDTVDSIFAILDDYHGYEKLVELLFGALRAIAKQGAQEPRLQIEGSKAKESSSYQPYWTPTKDIASLAIRLKERKAKHLPLPPDDSPNGPPDDPPISIPPSSPPLSSPPLPSDATPVLPAPQTYPLLLRISSLTAHYLPSPSPSLRLSLLTLLSDILPSLAAHEDSFLPLVNTLWPEIVSRLRDEEPGIVAAALRVIEGMGREAGGFMRGRVRDVWPELVRVGGRVMREVDGDAADTRRGGGAGRGVGREVEVRDKTGMAVGLTRRMEVGYVDPSVKGMWAALKGVMVVAVRDVGIGEDMFEDALGLLGPVEGMDEEERRVLEGVIVGAVWLARYKEGMKLDVPERIRETVGMYRWAGVTA
ncbi:armadillo-type protein [Elsinoe ampelina]|uniref:Armadillo-type protein n=1 Tax=Elsinoe ampelina TaxID=302913 RepID=A0A6A6FZY2_9PEZI|nr:armadillo-type protein [Elsinoe ampelina]